MTRAIPRALSPATAFLLATVVAASLLFGPQPRTAQAAPTPGFGISNIYASDEDGAPLNHFDPVDVLYVSGTVDLRGGIACVVPASTPVGAGGSCGGGSAWGGALPISAFAFGLSFFGVALVGAPLVEGAWRILGDNGPLPDDDVLSEPFTISCQHISCEVYEIPQAQKDLIKAHATLASYGWGLGCSLMFTLIVAPVAIATYTHIQLTGFSFGGAVGAVAVSIGVGVAGAVLPTADPIGLAQGSLYEYLCKNFTKASAIASDPPDIDFTQIALPEFGALPSGIDELYRPLIDELVATDGYSGAVLTSLERYQGAVEANATTYEHLQALALGSNAVATARHMHNGAAEARALADYLSGEPSETEVFMDQAKLDALLDFHDRIRTAGFNADELGILEDAGYASGQVEEVRAILSRDQSRTPVGQSRVEVLREIADALDEASNGFDAFGRLAFQVGNTLNTGPVATFTADPIQSVGAPVDVDFMNTSTSPDLDEIISTAWDFGDGATAEGTSVSHTYTEVGTYTAKLTVCDYLECAEATQQIYVGTTPTNQPPTVSFVVTPPSGGFAPVVHSFEASATDTDGTVDSYAWDFGDGLIGSGPRVSHRYEEAGTYFVVLTVTDDDGATASYAAFLSVLNREIPVCGDEDGTELPFVLTCDAEYVLTDDVQMYRLAGDATVNVRFDFVYRNAAFNKELGVFVVDGPDARIGDLLPGEDGYLAAAWERATTVFASVSNASTPDVQLSFVGGDYLVFYIIQNQTLETLLRNNPGNSPAMFPQAFFSLDALNPVPGDHMLGFRHIAGDHVQFGFEDIPGQTDFDDVVFNAYGSIEATPHLVVSKLVDADSPVAPGAPVRYSVTVTNNGITEAILDTISDDLPDDFTYQPGSTAGLTEDEPEIDSGMLTWAGDFAVPGGGSITLSFEATAAADSGTYFNVATATAAEAVLGSGPTAPVQVEEADQGASLTVVKATDPASDPQDFDFDLTGLGIPADLDMDTDAGDATLPSQQSFNLTAAQLGAHTVTESAIAGWSLTNLVCTGAGGDSSTNLGNRAATLDINAGENVVCTFTNTKAQGASLTVVKHVINDNGGTSTAGSFTMTVDDPGTNPTPFPGAESPGTMIAVDPGAYSVSETGPSGYAATFSADCTGAIALGETKTCIVTNNDLPGTIVIRKVIKPVGSTTNFAFDATGTSYADFGLAGGTQNSQTLDAGTYRVKELVPLGWVLTGIGGSTDADRPYDCSVTGTGGSTGVGDLTTQTATINLKNGDTITCLFENTGQGVTRSQGFWATHPQLARVAWFGGTAFGHTFPGVAGTAGIGDILICGRPIDTLGKVTGAFWSDISKLSAGKKRSPLDHARMQLLQQLVAAELNASAFGTTPTSGWFAAWEMALCGTTTNAIKTAQQQSASFNSVGDSGTFTPGTSADSKLARSVANIPFWDLIKP